MANVGDIIGRYRLSGRLGAGAMGEVWSADHTTLGTQVAIKIIHAETARNANALARFEREAILSAKLKSVHVVNIIDHGHHQGLPWQAMEHLEGQTLRERLNIRGRLEVHETAMVVRHVARALSKAHEIGLVHRDIKPSNLMVCPGEEDGEEIIKVLDFGIAKVTDELAMEGIVATRTGAMVGTPYYLSPEQAQGLKTVGPASDLWSLAVVAFECLTGGRPFDAPAMGPLIAKIIHFPIPSPSISPDINAWMMQALQRDPAQRFKSAKAFAQSFILAAGLSDHMIASHVGLGSGVHSQPQNWGEASSGSGLDKTALLDNSANTMAFPEAHGTPQHPTPPLGQPIQPQPGNAQQPGNAPQPGSTSLGVGGHAFGSGARPAPSMQEQPGNAQGQPGSAQAPRGNAHLGGTGAGFGSGAMHAPVVQGQPGSAQGRSAHGQPGKAPAGAAGAPSSEAWPVAPPMQKSNVPLIAAVVLGLIVLGGAGVYLASGGETAAAPAGAADASSSVVAAPGETAETDVAGASDAETSASGAATGDDVATTATAVPPPSTQAPPPPTATQPKDQPRTQPKGQPNDQPKNQPKTQPPKAQPTTQPTATYRRTL